MSNRLPVLAAEVRKAHAEAEKAALTAAERAIEAGRSLIEAKALVAHGEWLPWLAAVGVPKRTAQRYMALAASGLESGTVTLLGGIAAVPRFLSLRKLALAGLDAASARARLEDFDSSAKSICTACDLMEEMAGMLGSEDARASTSARSTSLPVPSTTLSS